MSEDNKNHNAMEDSTTTSVNKDLRSKPKREPSSDNAEHNYSENMTEEQTFSSSAGTDSQQRDGSKKTENSNDSNRNAKKESRRESIGLRSFAKSMIFGEQESEDKENTSSIFGTVLETGDKAKSEMYRMFGREVRNYLNALEIGQDVHNLLTNYSLEVSASIHLKPLSEKLKNNNAKEVKDDE